MLTLAEQKALAEKVDEAARQYISGPLKRLLAKEIAAVEEAAERPGHFSVGSMMRCPSSWHAGTKALF